MNILNSLFRDHFKTHINPYINDNVVNDINLVQLIPTSKFVFKDCMYLSASGFIKLFEYANMFNVKDLRIINCMNFDDDVVQQLCQNKTLQNLYFFELTHNQLVTIKQLPNLFDYLLSKRIIKLKLTHSINIDDDIIEILVNIMKYGHIQYLNLKYSKLVTNKSMKMIASFKNLNYLNISSCNNIDNEGILNIVALENLEILKMNNMDLITIDGIKYLIESKNMSKLKALCLNYCACIDTNAISELCRINITPSSSILYTNNIKKSQNSNHHSLTITKHNNFNDNNNNNNNNIINHSTVINVIPPPNNNLNNYTNMNNFVIINKSIINSNIMINNAPNNTPIGVSNYLVNNNDIAISDSSSLNDFHPSPNYLINLNKLGIKQDERIKYSTLYNILNNENFEKLTCLKIDGIRQFNYRKYFYMKEVDITPDIHNRINYYDNEKYYLSYNLDIALAKSKTLVNLIELHLPKYINLRKFLLSKNSKNIKRLVFHEGIGNCYNEYNNRNNSHSNNSNRIYKKYKDIYKSILIIGNEMNISKKHPMEILQGVNLLYIPKLRSDIRAMMLLNMKYFDDLRYLYLGGIRNIQYLIELFSNQNFPYLEILTIKKTELTAEFFSVLSVCLLPNLKKLTLENIQKAIDCRIYGIKLIFISNYCKHIEKLKLINFIINDNDKSYMLELYAPKLLKLSFESVKVNLDKKEFLGLKLFEKLNLTFRNITFIHGNKRSDKNIQIKEVENNLNLSDDEISPIKKHNSNNNNSIIRDNRIKHRPYVKIFTDNHEIDKLIEAFKQTHEIYPKFHQEKLDLDCIDLHDLRKLNQEYHQKLIRDKLNLPQPKYLLFDESNFDDCIDYMNNLYCIEGSINLGSNFYDWLSNINKAKLKNLPQKLICTIDAKDKTSHQQLTHEWKLFFQVYEHLSSIRLDFRQHIYGHFLGPIRRYCGELQELIIENADLDSEGFVDFCTKGKHTKLSKLCIWNCLNLTDIELIFLQRAIFCSSLKYLSIIGVKLNFSNQGIEEFIIKADYPMISYFNLTGFKLPLLSMKKLIKSFLIRVIDIDVDWIIEPEETSVIYEIFNTLGDHEVTHMTIGLVNTIIETCLAHYQSLGNIKNFWSWEKLTYEFKNKYWKILIMQFNALSKFSGHNTIDILNKKATKDALLIFLKHANNPEFLLDKELVEKILNEYLDDELLITMSENLEFFYPILFESGVLTSKIVKFEEKTKQILIKNLSKFNFLENFLSISDSFLNDDLLRYLLNALPQEKIRLNMIKNQQNITLKGWKIYYLTIQGISHEADCTPEDYLENFLRIFKAEIKKVQSKSTKSLDNKITSSQLMPPILLPSTNTTNSNPNYHNSNSNNLTFNFLKPHNDKNIQQNRGAIIVECLESQILENTIEDIQSEEEYTHKSIRLFNPAGINKFRNDNNESKIPISHPSMSTNNPSSNSKRRTISPRNVIKINKKQTKLPDAEINMGLSTLVKYEPIPISSNKSTEYCQHTKVIQMPLQPIHRDEIEPLNEYLNEDNLQISFEMLNNNFKREIALETDRETRNNPGTNIYTITTQHKFKQNILDSNHLFLSKLHENHLNIEFEQILFGSDVLNKIFCNLKKISISSLISVGINFDISKLFIKAYLNNIQYLKFEDSTILSKFYDNFWKELSTTKDLMDLNILEFDHIIFTLCNYQSNFSNYIRSANFSRIKTLILKNSTAIDRLFILMEDNEKDLEVKNIILENCNIENSKKLCTITHCKKLKILKSLHIKKSIITTEFTIFPIDKLSSSRYELEEFEYKFPQTDSGKLENTQLSIFAISTLYSIPNNITFLDNLKILKIHNIDVKLPALFMQYLSKRSNVLLDKINVSFTSIILEDIILFLQAEKITHVKYLKIKVNIMQDKVIECIGKKKFTRLVKLILKYQNKYEEFEIGLNQLLKSPYLKKLDWQKFYNQHRHLTDTEKFARIAIKESDIYSRLNYFDISHLNPNIAAKAVQKISKAMINLEKFLYINEDFLIQNDEILELLLDEQFYDLVPTIDINKFNSKRLQCKIILLQKLLNSPTQLDISQILLEYSNEVDDQVILLICRFSSKIQEQNIKIKLNATIHGLVHNIGLNYLVQQIPYTNQNDTYSWILVDDYWRNFIDGQTLQMIASNLTFSLLYHNNHLDFSKNLYLTSNGEYEIMKGLVQNLSSRGMLLSRSLSKYNNNYLEKLCNQRFTIFNMKFDDQSGDALLKVIKYSPFLKRISLSNKNFGDKFCENLSLIITSRIAKNAQYLQKIDLSNNPRITFIGLRYLYTTLIADTKINLIETSCETSLKPNINTLLSYGLYYTLKHKLHAYKQQIKRSGFCVYYDHTYIPIIMYTILCFPLSIWQLIEDSCKNYMKKSWLHKMISRKFKDYEFKKINNESEQEEGESLLVEEKHTIPSKNRFIFTPNCIKLNNFLRSRLLWIVFMINYIIYNIFCFFFPAYFFLECGRGHNWISHAGYLSFAIVSFILEFYIFYKIQKIINRKDIITINFWSILGMIQSQITRFTKYSNMLFFVIYIKCSNKGFDAELCGLFIFLHSIMIFYQIMKVVIGYINVKEQHNTTYINLASRLYYNLYFTQIAITLERFSTSSTVRFLGEDITQVLLTTFLTFIFQNLPQGILQIIELSSKEFDGYPIILGFISTILSLIASTVHAFRVKPSICTSEMVLLLSKADRSQYFQTIQRIRRLNGTKDKGKNYDKKKNLNSVVFSLKNGQENNQSLSRISRKSQSNGIAMESAYTLDNLIGLIPIENQNLEFGSIKLLKEDLDDEKSYKYEKACKKLEKKNWLMASMILDSPRKPKNTRTTIKIKDDKQFFKFARADPPSLLIHEDFFLTGYNIPTLMGGQVSRSPPKDNKGTLESILEKSIVLPLSSKRQYLDQKIQLFKVKLLAAQQKHENANIMNIPNYKITHENEGYQNEFLVNISGNMGINSGYYQKHSSNNSILRHSFHSIIRKFKSINTINALNDDHRENQQANIIIDSDKDYKKKNVHFNDESFIESKSYIKKKRKEDGDKYLLPETPISNTSKNYDIEEGLKFTRGDQGIGDYLMEIDTKRSKFWYDQGLNEKRIKY